MGKDDLNEIESFVEQFVESIPDPAVLVNREGEIRSANSSVPETFGYSVDEVEGGRIEKLLPEEVRDRHVAYRDSYFQDPNPRPMGEDLELKGRRKDGETFPVEVSLGPIEIDGGEYVLATAMDVTRRKEMRGRLRQQNENLVLVNQILRHDVCNDVNVITGMAQALQSQGGEEAKDRLEAILETSRHITDLTKTAREFIEMTQGGGEVETKPLDVAEELKSTLQSWRTSYEEAVLRTPGEIPETDVEANELLSTIFRNLLNNAVQHNDKERPEIEVSAEKSESHVIVSVADNGPGVPDDHKESILGEGEKGLESEGTGIGLYLVNTLVHGYGGDVWIADNDPEGAVFRVSLKKA